MDNFKAMSESKGPNLAPPRTWRALLETKVVAEAEAKRARMRKKDFMVDVRG